MKKATTESDSRYMRETEPTHGEGIAYSTRVSLRRRERERKMEGTYKFHSLRKERGRLVSVLRHVNTMGGNMMKKQRQRKADEADV